MEDRVEPLQKRKQGKKKKPKTINRKLAAMQIKPIEVHVDIGGEQKVVHIAMDTADPDELGMVKIAEDDNSEFWIQLQSRREKLLMKEIDQLKKDL